MYIHTYRYICIYRDAYKDVYVCVSAQSFSCIQLCGLITCGQPVSSTHGILQARIQEWVAISLSKESSRPRNRTLVSRIFCFGRWILCHCVTWEAQAPYTHGDKIRIKYLENKVLCQAYTTSWQIREMHDQSSSHARC